MLFKGNKKNLRHLKNKYFKGNMVIGILASRKIWNPSLAWLKLRLTSNSSTSTVAFTLSLMTSASALADSSETKLSNLFTKTLCSIVTLMANFPSTNSTFWWPKTPQIFKKRPPSKFFRDSSRPMTPRTLNSTSIWTMLWRNSSKLLLFRLRILKKKWKKAKFKVKN